MGWDPKSVERLPNGHGELFPAFLTWRGALDKRVIDLMRPLFAAGLRPEVNCCVCVILVLCLPLNSWHSSTEVCIRVQMRRLLPPCSWNCMSKRIPTVICNVSTPWNVTGDSIQLSKRLCFPSSVTRLSMTAGSPAVIGWPLSSKRTTVPFEIFWTVKSKNVHPPDCTGTCPTKNLITSVGSMVRNFSKTWSHDVRLCHVWI